MSRGHIVLLVVWLPGMLGQGPSTPEQSGAKLWVGRHQEIEEYLKTAECATMRPIAPSASQCTLRPGGPVARMAWRPRPPGIHRGFRESYKTEIAAYELDKLLKMDMVPPTVERQLDGSMGAAQLWVENVIDGADPAAPTGDARVRWDRQLVQMTMFDVLIGNRDRNRRNMLHDRGWSLILIDHSRAFGVETELHHKPQATDDAFWERIERLTRTQLEGALGTWLHQHEIDAILDRREKMRADIKARLK